MKKLAIFVEGLTEELFVKRLLTEIANINSISFQTERLSGGSSCPRTTVMQSIDSVGPSTQYYVLIYNSCTDNRITSDYRERYHTLITSGYTNVLGLRDLYPNNYTDLTNIQRLITASLSLYSIPNNIHIAIREEETWFLGEYSHFNKIDNAITLPSIHSTTGYSFPMAEYEHTITHPAATLHQIYRIGHKAYRKKQSHIERTLNKIDFTELYYTVRHNIPSLNNFLHELDSFFS